MVNDDIILESINGYKNWLRYDSILNIDKSIDLNKQYMEKFGVLHETEVSLGPSQHVSYSKMCSDEFDELNSKIIKDYPLHYIDALLCYEQAGKEYIDIRINYKFSFNSILFDMSYLSFSYISTILHMFDQIQHGNVTITKFKEVKQIDFDIQKNLDELTNDLLLYFSMLNEDDQTKLICLMKDELQEMQCKKFYQSAQKIKLVNNNIVCNVHNNRELDRLKTYLEDNDLHPTDMSVTFMQENPEFGCDVVKTVRYVPDDFYKCFFDNDYNMVTMHFLVNTNLSKIKEYEGFEE